MREALWESQLKTGLREAGILLLKPADLSAAEKKRAGEHFRAEVYPLLTPLAVDPAHPFPFLSNLSHSIGVKLHH